jgi:outer membrane protein TolC
MNTRFNLHATIKILGFTALTCMALLPLAQATLSLDQAVSAALEHDPWLRGNQLKQGALEASSIAAQSLPDPLLSFGLLNVPMDGFALDQEPMTQIRLGLAQTFPRGDSQAIRARQLRQLAGQHPLLAQDRKAKVELRVSLLWLQAYRAEQSIRLIEQDRALFEQLAAIVQASYSSAQGKTRQQDVVRAQLELSRLDDRLSLLHQEGDMAVANLMEWLVVEPHAGYKKTIVADTLPSLRPLPKELSELSSAGDRQQLLGILTLHPAILAIEQRIQASISGVHLAEQKYQAQWGLKGSYAYRANDQSGATRADFFSLGLSVDLPLFTANRQDQDVAASRMQAESMKTDKLLLMRKMMAQLEGLYAQYQGLSIRLKLYNDSILPQMHEQAEAALTAYTNDDGSFAEVMRARISELNGRIEHITLSTELLAAQIHIHYFFSASQARPFLAQGVKP